MIEQNAAPYLELRHRPLGVAVMRQQWADLLFLHWKISPAEIQRLLPKGLFVDTFHGDAWIGIVPFAMNRIRPSFLPPMPGISWFLELNVRTYVYDQHGIPGVWFFSLDCNQPLAVSLAQQWFHLPYQHAEIQVKKSDGWINYSCRRDSDIIHETAHFRYQACKNGNEAQIGTLEFFLLERYLLFSVDQNGQIYSGQVHHAPYRFTQAICQTYSSLPLQWEGFSSANPPDSLLTAEAVDVAVFPLRKTS